MSGVRGGSVVVERTASDRGCYVGDFTREKDGLHSRRQFLKREGGEEGTYGDDTCCETLEDDGLVVVDTLDFPFLVRKSVARYIGVPLPLDPRSVSMWVTLDVDSVDDKGVPGGCASEELGGSVET